MVGTNTVFGTGCAAEVYRLQLAVCRHAVGTSKACLQACAATTSALMNILQLFVGLRILTVIMAIASYSQPAMRVTLLNVILNVKELH